MTWSAQPALHLCVDETDIRWLVQSGELVLISLYDSQWKGTGPLFISSVIFKNFIQVSGTQKSKSWTKSAAARSQIRYRFIRM